MCLKKAGAIGLIGLSTAGQLTFSQDRASAVNANTIIITAFKFKLRALAKPHRVSIVLHAHDLEQGEIIEVCHCPPNLPLQGLHTKLKSIKNDRL